MKIIQNEDKFEQTSRHSVTVIISAKPECTVFQISKKNSDFRKIT